MQPDPMSVEKQKKAAVARRNRLQKMKVGTLFLLLDIVVNDLIIDTCFNSIQSAVITARPFPVTAHFISLELITFFECLKLKRTMCLVILGAKVAIIDADGRRQGRLRSRLLRVITLAAIAADGRSILAVTTAANDATDARLDRVGRSLQYGR